MKNTTQTKGNCGTCKHAGHDAGQCAHCNCGQSERIGYTAGRKPTLGQYAKLRGRYYTYFVYPK